MRQTTFRIYGIGKAASNLPLRSKQLNVFLPEQNNLREGEIIAASSRLDYETTDIDGVAHAGTAEAKTYETATWLPLGSNRVFPPSIRRGESVVLWTTGDGGQYYWTDAGMDGHLRRRDTLVVAISNTVDETTEALTYENAWFVEFSTHSKKVALYTNKSDGEPYAYEIVLDARDGEFLFRDDIGNVINLVSKDTKLELKNALGSTISATGDVITLTNETGDLVTLEADVISASNSTGSAAVLDGETITASSPAGGSIAINGDVILQSAGGAKLSLVGATATLEAGGATVNLATGIVRNN